MIKNSKNKSNKRAVTRFTALFICMILVCSIALPLFVFGDDIQYVNIYIDKPSTYSYVQLNCIKVVDGNTTTETHSIYQSGTYPYILVGENCYFNAYAYSSSYNPLTGRYNSYYYRCLINGIEGTTSSTGTNVSTPLTLTIVNSSYSSQSSAVRYWNASSGYTLTFNSQGGSSISPLTGVSGIVHLGESGQYYPQYVPSLYGYDFVGWSLTENGTILFDVDVQSDTVLYARWSIQSQYVNIRFGDGFYEDSSCTDDLYGYFGVKGELLTFYAKKKLYQYTDITYDPLEHFYGSIHYSIGTVGYDMEGEMISGTDNPTEERIYKYTLYLDDSYYIQVNSAPLYKCWFRFITGDYQEFNTGINYVAWYGQTFAPLWYRETNSYLYTTDSYLGMELEVWIRLPYIINRPYVFDPALLLGDEYDQRVNHDLRFSENIVEDNTAYGATIHYHIITNPFQTQDELDESEFVNIILTGKAISDYDITDEYSAIIVYDENSNASWAFSEVELLDTDWSEVNENIPTKLNSFFGGLFSLSGLAVLIPMVMMVSFAIWFIRRS